MRRVLVFTSLVVVVLQTMAQQQDKEAIKAMCGCFEVIFKYAETFRSDTVYDFHDNHITGASAEWIFVDEETEDQIVIQHILVARDTIVIKHWRQDWLYENQILFSYIKNHHWKKEVLPEDKVESQWSQKVYHVDDGPRYQGSATWVHADGKHYWENTTDAPLPRREHTKRNDYNVMQRRNRHQITDYGWLHEQDNKKIIRKEGKDSVLVMEKGYNIYKKIDESNCLAAKVWWQENKAYWRLVREVWSDVFSESDGLSFQTEIDSKKRWQRLFELQEAFKGDNVGTIKKEIRGIIDLYANQSPVNQKQVKPGENEY